MHRIAPILVVAALLQLPPALPCPQFPTDRVLTDREQAGMSIAGSPIDSTRRC